jgi:hypothetical protein
VKSEKVKVFKEGESAPMMFIAEDRSPRYIARCRWCSWKSAPQHYADYADADLEDHKRTAEHRNAVLSALVERVEREGEMG